MGEVGWQVGEVAALLDMPRRAIQRVCGKNARSKDLGIVDVPDSKPGRRVYRADQLAQLWVVKSLNRTAKNLMVVREKIDEARSARGFAALFDERLEHHIEREEDERAEVLRGRALAAAEDPEALARLLEREAASQLALGGCAGPFPTGWLAPAVRSAAKTGEWEPADGGACIQPNELLAALEFGGMDTAIELMCGPNTYERVICALEEASNR